jgi:monovalent cation:H+ antiporter-2, CPA2 family
MHELDLIVTLAGSLGAALVFGYLTQRGGLSPIVGYLVAGVALGPYTPGFIANQALAEQLAEVGVILLLFGVGLQFKIEELLAVRRVAVPGALIASAAVAAMGAVAAHAAAWSWASSIVFGLTLSVASTVVLVRVLSDNRELHTSSGHIAVGWLVVEDVFTVLVLVLLPAIFAGNATPAQIATSAALTLAKVGALVLVAAIVGPRLIPRLLDRVAATRSRELFTLTILVLALGIAAASTVFGMSMPLGAFLAGLVVGRSDYSLRAATEALPMRDAFAVLFFVSVGMLLDPVAIMQSPGLVIAALLTVVIGKPVVASLLLWMMRYPLRTILTVALSLGQIGEFSFILSVLGRDLGILPADAMNIIVAVSIASITLTPIASRLADPAERWWMRTRSSELGTRTAEPGAGAGASSSLNPRERAVVVGYGPTGRTVARLLRDNDIAPTIIELNMDTVRALRQDGVSAIYGDARHADTLITAGVRHAGTLIVSGADSGASETIRNARDINPELHVFARGAYLRDVPPLRGAGAEQVFSGEGEVALAMTEAVLRRLGATPEQIDRERARVHDELSGSSASHTSRHP